jgi:hypothetical protein
LLLALFVDEPEEFAGSILTVVEGVPELRLDEDRLGECSEGTEGRGILNLITEECALDEGA